MVKKVGKYELGRPLGEGTFGKVKFAIDTETNDPVAIKILDKEKIQKQNMGNQIKKEISIMKMVKHKYVVGMIEVLASKTKIFIVLELVTGGELFDKIVQVGKLSEDQARFYFNQLAEGVQFCHNMGVCHRDLKPENLLLDEHGNLKISDFGLSSLYIGDAEGESGNRTELLHTTCGTPNYVAPEVLADCGYDGKKADVWSCGVILYVLLAGFLPFDESTIVALFAKIQAAEFTYPSWFSPEVRTLLDQMIVADVKARWTLAKVRSYAWCLIGQDASAAAEATAAAAAASSSPDLAKKASMAAAGEAEAAFQHEGEEFEEGEGEEEKKGLVALNAFDIVSQCGGFMIDRMFSPEVFYEPAGVPAGGPGSFHKQASGAVLFGGTKKSNKTFHCSSSCAPQELIRRVHDSLVEMDFTCADSAAEVQSSCSLRADKNTAKGMIGIFVQVFFVSPELSLVEIKRGKGDLMEWSLAFAELTEKRIGDLLNTPKPGEDAKDST